jgi:hypothetical protein
LRWRVTGGFRLRNLGSGTASSAANEAMVAYNPLITLTNSFGVNFLIEAWDMTIWAVNLRFSLGMEITPVWVYNSLLNIFALMRIDPSIKLAA